MVLREMAEPHFDPLRHYRAELNEALRFTTLA